MVGTIYRAIDVITTAITNAKADEYNAIRWVYNSIKKLTGTTSHDAEIVGFYHIISKNVYSV